MTILQIIVIVLLTTVIGVGSVKVLGKDNPVEEVAEAIVKEQTGLDIDFTPENDKH